MNNDTNNSEGAISFFFSVLLRELKMVFPHSPLRHQIPQVYVAGTPEKWRPVSLNLERQDRKTYLAIFGTLIGYQTYNYQSNN